MTARSPAKPGRTSGRPRCAELENEAWLLRCLLDFFRSRREIAAALTFVERCLEAVPAGETDSGSLGRSEGIC